jgi:hypothetical protein
MGIPASCSTFNAACMKMVNAGRTWWWQEWRHTTSQLSASLDTGVYI